MSWSDWREAFAKACDGSHHTIASIEQALIEGRLYPLYGEGCCYLVEIVRYPVETSCQVMWAAGSLDAILENLPRLHEWAKAQGCTEMLVEGHAGWQRALKAQDYRPWSVTLRRAL